MNAYDLLERLGEVEPIDQRVMDTTARSLHRAVAEGVAADVGGVERLPRLVRTRRRWVRRVVAVAAAAALIGVATVVIRPGSTGGPTPAAAAELEQLAQVAAAQPAATPPGPGQYQYTDSQEAYTSSTYDGPGHSYTVQLPETRQIWIGADGSGRLLETFGAAIFLSPQDRADWVTAGSPDLATAPTDESFGPGGLSDGPTDLSTLPTDPSALAALISSRRIEGGPPGPSEDFAQIGDLLRETDASPALRAALYQVAANLPGVLLLGAVADHSGRPGVGVGYNWGGVQHELIFDPTTSALLGEEDVTVATGWKPGTTPTEPVGTVNDWVVYLQSGVVDGTGAGPSTAVVPPPNDTGGQVPTPADSSPAG
jgi:hypothetical protein